MRLQLQLLSRRQWLDVTHPVQTPVVSSAPRRTRSVWGWYVAAGIVCAIACAFGGTALFIGSGSRLAG